MSVNANNKPKSSKPKVKPVGQKLKREVLQLCDECKKERGRYCRTPNCKIIET